MPRTAITLVAVAAAITLGATGVHAVAPQAIQPGDSTRNGCTLDFVFDNPNGDVFVGIAGHCVSDGDRVATFQGDFGTVVYDSADQNGRLDIALVEVDEDKEDRVVAQVKGHPNTPTGVAQAAETRIGDRLLMSGYGVATQWNSATRENRSAVLFFQNDHEYCAEAPVSPGDSGGPIVHADTGQALGIVSRLSPFECAGTLIGASVQGFLDQVNDDGFDLTLRTV